MEQIHDRVAGLDVHRDQVTACVRTPGPRGGVQTGKARFNTTTGGLAALAEWLAGHAVTLAAMEAAGVYWKPVYYALEDRFVVWLCNAHHVKNVPGRKTDPLTELRREVPQVSGRTGMGVATVADHDHRERCAAGPVPAGGAAARVA
jgi:transposase